jgi:hypothetical protein
MTLQTRISGFLACIKILSAFTWLQNMGMKASMRESGSEAWEDKTSSRSAGKAGGLEEADIFKGRELVECRLVLCLLLLTL